MKISLFVGLFSLFFSLTVSTEAYAVDAACPAEIVGQTAGMNCPNNGPTNVSCVFATVGNNCLCIPAAGACGLATVSSNELMKQVVNCRYFYKEGDDVPQIDLESCYPKVKVPEAKAPVKKLRK